MRLLMGIVAGILLVTAPRASEAFCAAQALPMGSTRSWPVYLFTGDVENGVWQDGIDVGEAEAMLQAALDQWWEESGADVRLYYAGRTTSSSTSNRTLVVPDDDCSCGSGRGACATVGAAGRVRVEAQQCVRDRFPATLSNFTWTTDSGVADGNLREVLVHEFGHSLGLRHSFDDGSSCPGGGSQAPEKPFTVMGNSRDRTILHLREDDRAGVITLYGSRNDYLQWYTADDGLNASGPYEESGGARFTSARPHSGGTPLLRGNVLGTVPGVVGSWINHSSGTMAEQAPPGALTYHPVAAVLGRSSNHRVLAWTSSFQQNNRSNETAPGKIGFSTDGGESWTVVTAPVLAAGPPTATWDPVSQAYVVMWKEKTFFYSETGALLAELDTPLATGPHGPAFECAATGDTYNCFLATEAPMANGCPNTSRARVDLSNGTIVLANLDTTCTTSTGPSHWSTSTTRPALTYVHDGASARSWMMVTRSHKAMEIGLFRHWNGWQHRQLLSDYRGKFLSAAASNFYSWYYIIGQGSVVNYVPRVYTARP